MRKYRGLTSTGANMAIEPSSSAIDPSPGSAERPYPPSHGLVAAVAAILGWFFGWPVVFFAFPALVKADNELQHWLFGAIFVLWFLSCFVVYGMLLATVEVRWPVAARIWRGLGFLLNIVVLLELMWVFLWHGS